MCALIADKGYDGDGFRAEIVNRGARPVIPNKSNRTTLHRFDKRAYKGRNVIERCFCRLKDFRRILTPGNGGLPSSRLSRVGSGKDVDHIPPGSVDGNEQSSLTFSVVYEDQTG